jgi:hypothetical protein
MKKTVQLTVTVFVDADQPLEEMAQAVDTALMNAPENGHCIDDWSIENDKGQTYEWNSYEQAGSFGS